MPYPVAARDYLLKALETTPLLITALLEGKAPQWDRRPDPERFTLREVLAHLADWEPIWLERVKCMATEDFPFLPSVDESALVIENDYANCDPEESIAKQRQGRAALVRFLSPLPIEAWDRTGNREFVGVLTLQQQAAMTLSHDGYHLRQIVEWLG
jgi:hypothetical protein